MNITYLLLVRISLTFLFKIIKPVFLPDTLTVNIMLGSINSKRFGDYKPSKSSIDIFYTDIRLPKCLFFKLRIKEKMAYD